MTEICPGVEQQDGKNRGGWGGSGHEMRMNTGLGKKENGG